MTERLYAIGDIHGQLDKLKDLHAAIAEDARTHKVTPKIIHLGDYIDRGPDSAGVINYLMEGHASGENWVSIKGNHDLYLELFCEDPHQRGSSARHLHWFNPRLGGSATLQSYGVNVDVEESDNEAMAVDINAIAAEARAKIPQQHLDFMRTLPFTFRRGRAFFVHAGVRPHVPLHEQKIDDLIWIREPFFDAVEDFGVLVIHGHTIYDRVTHFGNRVGVDTGAGKGKTLSALIIEDNALFSLDSQAGRQEVLPPAGWSLFGERV